MSADSAARAPSSADGVEVDQVEATAFAGLTARLGLRLPVDSATSRLVDSALDVWSRPGFDTLVSLSRVHFEPFDHQIATVRVVLRRMRGRAILADEVGLGKTIEAALVLSELRARGLARRALIVTPAGLVGQWQEELDRKFALPSQVVTGSSAGDLESAGANGIGAGGEHPVVLASLAAARRDPLRSVLVGRDWDAVIVDEAHRVRNPRSASGRLARELRSRQLLLLTATPVENRLDDLFQLVSLVAPGPAWGLRSLARLAGSSPAALAPALARAGWGDLAIRAEAIRRSRKEEVLIERVKEHLERQEKVIVFNAFTRHSNGWRRPLRPPGVDVVRYHGGLSRAAKDAAVRRFEGETGVLVSTEAAGEGRNLQFCHVMVNMDLPWNPMQIEQRIGRLHRIGQQHDVVVTNCRTSSTVAA